MTVRRAVAEDRDAVVRALVRAFDVDPLPNYLLRADAGRERAFATVFDVAFRRLTLPTNGAWVAEGGAGAALWTPPGEWKTWRALADVPRLAWAVGAFRLATSGAADATQIHTHMCYSEFGEIIDAIAGLDADVTTVEAARSRMEFIADLTAAGYARGIGPGVWDIHSPRVPDVAEMAEALILAVGVIGPTRLWANPDCGLKTRGYAETEAALRNLVAAARQVRAGIAD